MLENMSDTEALAALKWQLDMGVDELVDVEPLNRFALARKASVVTGHAPKHRPDRSQQRSKESPKERKAIPTENPQQTAADTALGSVSDALQAAGAAETLTELEAALRQFKGGTYQRTAKNLVFASGNPDADLMLIGEAPGAEEDRQGEPFVGPSGALLEKMLAAIGLNRATDCYITNIIPWRPLGNRTPDTEMVQAFLPFVYRHIALVAPKVVVTLGGVSAKGLLDTPQGITRLRGRWASIDPEKTGLDHDIALMPTYHPAYLLRNPLMKAQSWQDLLAIKETLASKS